MRTIRITLGNKFEAALWGARKITDSLSASIKFDYSSQDEIDGQHKGLTMINMNPAKQTSSHGRDITTFGLGLNYYFQNGKLNGHRLAAEKLQLIKKLMESSLNSIQFGHLVGNMLGNLKELNFIQFSC